MAYGHETWWIVHEAREIRSKNTTYILYNTWRPSEANAPFWLSLPNNHPGSPLACTELCALRVFWVRSNNQQTVSFSFSLCVWNWLKTAQKYTTKLYIDKFMNFYPVISLQLKYFFLSLSRVMRNVWYLSRHSLTQRHIKFTSIRRFL